MQHSSVAAGVGRSCLSCRHGVDVSYLDFPPCRADDTAHSDEAQDAESQESAVLELHAEVYPDPALALLI